jgi:hypothetical protein
MGQASREVHAMTAPYGLPYVYETTIVPQGWDLFIPYFNRLYEQIASTVNNKDNIAYTMAVTSTPQDIAQTPQFGAFIICVSGVASTLPTLTASLCKSDATQAGSIAILGSQAGTANWAGFSLTIISTATNFQISHNNTGLSGAFNIRLTGTQM